MSGVAPKHHEARILGAVPSTTLINVLGAHVELAVDPALPPGTVSLMLEPPENFDDSFVRDTTLRVRQAPDKLGGKVRLTTAVGVALGNVSINTTQARVDISGSPTQGDVSHSLQIGGRLSVATAAGPDSGTSLSQVQVSGVTRIRGSFTQAGGNTFTGGLIRS